VDIVLFSSPGGNDALDGADLEDIIANVNSIIDKIQAHNSNITIIIELLAPGKTSFMTEEYKLLFAQMKTVITQIANSHTTATSEVVVVDMATGFTDGMLADDIHYNQAGAAFIAERYYNTLVPFLD
jgi:lysophospholipase L1-like esterase